MGAVRAVLAIALRRRKIASNPAAGIKVDGPKRLRKRDPSFTATEATAILSASLLPPSASLSAYHAFARRWVPWLCAYSGARVGEMTQLTKADIQAVDGIPCARIPAEATKTRRARTIPLHPHLLAQGFLEAVAKRPSGPLFFDPTSTKDHRKGAQSRSEDMAEWVRKIGVTDPNVQPNHGWRHTFKRIAREPEVAMNPEVRDYLQGHVPRTEGEKYGATFRFRPSMPRCYASPASSFLPMPKPRGSLKDGRRDGRRKRDTGPSASRLPPHYGPPVALWLSAWLRLGRILCWLLCGRVGVLFLSRPNGAPQ